jgi:hypothetical protein
VLGAALATTRPPRAALVVLLPADRVGSGGARLDPIMSGKTSALKRDEEEMLRIRIQESQSAASDLRLRRKRALGIFVLRVV